MEFKLKAIHTASGGVPHAHPEDGGRFGFTVEESGTCRLALNLACAMSGLRVF